MTARAAPSAARTTAAPKNLAELVTRLGGIPLERIRMSPPPGTATEADLEQHAGPMCELIDGTLVEKAMGNAESFMGIRIASLVWQYVEAEGLGVVLGEAGFIRLGRGKVRGPDVTYIPWENLPGGEVPPEPFWRVAPGLVVEVLSPSNTAAEIDRKLAELFRGGCKLAWVIDPDAKTAKVYTTAKRFEAMDGTGVLDGGKVLPGFSIPLANLFTAPKKRKRRRG